MPDTTENNLTDSLGLEVDALLADMAAACDRLQQQLGDAPGASALASETPAPAPVQEASSTASESVSNDDLSSLVEEMNRESSVSDPEAQAAAAPPEPAAAGTASSEPVVPGDETRANDDLNHLVSTMLDEEASKSATEPHAAADAPEPPMHDAGPTHAEEGSEAAAVVEPVSPPEALAPPVAVADAAPAMAEVMPTPAPVIRSIDVPAVAPAAIAPARVPAPEVTAPAIQPAAHEPIRHLSHRVKDVALATTRRYEPHALRAASAMTVPVAARARGLIDTIGWVGMYTMFLGASLWVYIKVIHKPASPMPLDPEVKLADEHAHTGEAGEVVRHSVERKAEQAAHAEAKADAGHGEAKKDDGHGEKKPAVKKEKPKPIAQLPKAPKPGEKKKAEPKKDDGHGGGGH